MKIDRIIKTRVWYSRIDIVGRIIFWKPWTELVNSFEFKADFRTCVATNVKTTLRSRKFVIC